MQNGTKIKDASYWLVVTDKKDKLIVVKKVFIKHKVTVNCQIDLPSDV
jgi:hypothetical protein